MDTRKMLSEARAERHRIEQEILSLERGLQSKDTPRESPPKLLLVAKSGRATVVRRKRRAKNTSRAVATPDRNS